MKFPSEPIPTPKVGDPWYRYEDKWYSIADEWGDHSHSRLEVQLWVQYVAKVTPKGVWLVTGKVEVDEIFKVADYNQAQKEDWLKFVCHDWNKKFACATKEEALESLVARRKRQKQIYEARARSAGEVLLHIEMNRKKLLEQKGY